MADGIKDGKKRATYGDMLPALAQRFFADQHAKTPELTVEKLQAAADRMRQSPDLTTVSIDRQHFYDALAYGQGVAQTRIGRAPDGPESFSDAEMVMDMLRRGYAVVKSKDRSMPEVLDEG